MSRVKLYIATSKIWSHFFANLHRFDENEDCIAENKEIGRSLYLSSEGFIPELILYDKDNRPIVWRPVRSQEECTTAANYMIMRYLDKEDTCANTSGDKSKGGSDVIELPSAETINEHKPATIQNGNSVKSENETEYDEEEEEQAIMDEIYRREDELEKAVGDCLAIILLEDDITAVKEYDPNLIATVVDDICDYLYNIHQISVYRPTMLVDESTGEDVYAEFPYGWNTSGDDIDK